METLDPFHNMQHRYWQVIAQRWSSSERQIDVIGPKDTWLRATWIRGTPNMVCVMHCQRVFYSTWSYNHAAEQVIDSAFPQERTETKLLLSVAQKSFPNDRSNLKKCLLSILDQSMGPKAQERFLHTGQLLGAVLPWKAGRSWYWSPYQKYAKTKDGLSVDLKTLKPPPHTLIERIYIVGQGLLINIPEYVCSIPSTKTAHEQTKLIETSMEIANKYDLSLDQWQNSIRFS